jgi:hypothetical protein
MPSKKTSVKKVAKELLESTADSVSLPVVVKPSRSSVSKQRKESSVAHAKTLTNEELEEVLAQIPIVRAWAAAVEAEALTRLLHGQEIPGYKLVEGRSNRTWSNEESVRKALMKMGFSVDQFSPREFLSPAGIEDLLKKFKKSDEWDTIAPYITRPLGKNAIAPAIDPRPELTRGSEFKEVPHDEY